MDSIRHSFVQQADAHAAGAATVARTVERHAERGRGAGSPGVGRRGVGRRGAGLGAGRRGDKPPSQRNGEAYARRRMAKTNAKTNVTSIITAPEKRKTSESSITRLSA